MSAEVRAADLPEGSIVALRLIVCVKYSPDEPTLPWRCADPVSNSMYVNYADDDEVQGLLDDGGTVLRHGYGEEQP